MASKSITVRDFKDAITKKIIPGSFNSDRTEFTFDTIESLTSRKKKTTWVLHVKLLDKGGKPIEIKDSYLVDGKTQLPSDWKAQITVEGKQEGGKVRDIEPTYVTVGKNIGKKSSTNIVQQAIRDALSLYNKQKKKANPNGSQATEIKEGQLDSRLTPPPMGLKKMGTSRGSTFTEEDFKNGVTVQRKFNGVRVVAFYDWDKKEVKFYSRTGADYPGMDHIRRELLPVLSDPPKIEELEQKDPNCKIANPKVYSEETRLGDKNTNRGKVILYIDGEFYLFGKPLEFISGQSRGSEGEAMLEYHIYDCFFPSAIGMDDKTKNNQNLSSACRQKYLDLVFDKIGKFSYHIRRVENFRVNNLKEIEDLTDKFIKEGYEGAVARRDSAGYRYSYNHYKSDDIVKIKRTHDEEFKIVGFKEGKKGKDKGALIWIAEIDEKNAKIKSDREFSAVPKDMTLEERKKLFKCLSEEVTDDKGKKVTRFVRDFLGKPLTVQYSEFSDKTGKPLQPKAITVRTYENAGTDPLKKAFDDCNVPKQHLGGGEPFSLEKLDMDE